MLLFITSVTCFIVPVLSRYSGDVCHDSSSRGTCKPLSECQHLLDEIDAAGSPMPMRMRQRLHDVSCGFSYEEPLVCCTMDQVHTNKPTTSDIDTHANWGSTESSNRQTENPFSKNPNRIDTDSGIQDVSNHPNLKLLPRDCGTIDSNRILGGNRTALYEMPWMVILSYDEDGVNKMACGGTLINEWYVLTAAHCIDLGSRLILTGAIVGEYDLRTDPDCEIIAGKKNCAPRAMMKPDPNCPKEKVLSCAPNVLNVTIDEVIPHPGYRRQTLFDDIALLRLSRPANFNLDNMAPICLPVSRSLQQDNLDDLFATVAGWGITEDKIPSPVLLSVALPIISNAECLTAYRNSPRIYSTQMCAGGLTDRDSCGGDSGGPLMYPGLLGSGGVRYVQRGIVSFGPRSCGSGALPGVYTRVSHYMKWILDNMHS